VKEMKKTKKMIFNAAITAFSQKGYHKSTMDEIAEVAGVAKGTLYYHFKSKEDIFKFVIEEGIKTLEDEIKDKTEYYSSPIEKLRALCRIQLELSFKYMEFFKTILSQMWGDEERQAELRCAFDGYFKLIEGYLREAAGEGQISNGNFEMIAFNFFGITASTLVYSLVHGNKDINELTDTMIEFIIKGISN
jgi:AcrR family transcriptional regulator